MSRNNTSGPNPIGDVLRTYRLAVAATGEYTQFHGGTVEDALAAIATTMNRVNGVYERELSSRMILVDSNHLIIFTDPNTDPYGGGNSLGTNQTVVDNNIGNANYDIGHLMTQGGGGVASLRSVCDNGDKARGLTGLAQPVGDPFDIDFVAHEIGHQFGGNHTFNSTTGSCNGNRVSNAAYEPGGATTIMGYAGICGANNIQLNSDDYFHNRSLEEIVNHIVLGQGNSCATMIPTENTAPVVDAGPDGYVIPVSTPFELIGSATDLEDTTLTYAWEQFDLGPSGDYDDPQGNAPLFRSFQPDTLPVRVFPRYSKPRVKYREPGRNLAFLRKKYAFQTNGTR